MGIQGLLPLLKSIQKPVSIGADFSGQVIGVDTYCWLHKGAYGCAMELVEGKKSPMYVNYVLKRVDMLLHFNVKPVLVFDGSYLPSKAGQEARRRKTRQENKAKGLAFLRSGNRQQAFECFQKCVDITPEMALEVIKECRKKGVDCIVAPYEADAQLAYLMKSGITQAIISEDSDLLVYGCQKVIFKMDACGHGVAVDLADLSKLTNLKLHEFSQEKFRHMCILSGCDYLPSIKGVGLQTAIKLLRKSSCVYKLIRSLRLDSKMQVPAGYEKNFKQADETFLYQLVFDPISTSLVPLNQLPDGIKPGDLEFAGPFMLEEKALGIALGNINPNSGEVMADFNPKKTKVFTRGGGDEPCSSDDNCGSRALTPDPVSSWGYSVMSKRGKTEYDVQKSLSGLMLNSQSSAKSKKPFVPPGQKRKANEDSLDDDSLATMYTSLKTRPRPMLRHARTVPGHAKRSRYKNPFRVGDQETETKDTRGELSRYFKMVGSPESLSNCSSNGTDKPDQRPPEERLEIGGDEDTATGNISEPGALLSAAGENITDRLLTDGESENCTIDIEKNKENELRTSDSSIAGHFTVVEKVECLENKRKEVADCHRGSPRKMALSPRKPVHSQGVLTNHSVNRSDTQLNKPAHTNLTDRFGYKRSFKAMEEKPDSNESVSVATVKVIDIDSGYLSEGETSMDCDTPSSTPTLPCFPRLTPPSSEGNLARLLKQGSAVGTKTMQHQIQLKSKTGVRSSGLGRCRSMGITRKKSKQNISKESSNSDASSTLLSYFAFDRHKKPRLEDNQSESSNSW